MKHLLVTLGTALLVVGAFLLARPMWRDATGGAAPDEPEATRPAGPDAPAVEPVAPARGVLIPGVSEIEALHRAHGKVGDAMRAFLAQTTNRDRGAVDRATMQPLIHALRAQTRPEDIAYLVEVFNRTPDPSFRWWFSWFVQQVPDPAFVDAMTAVYRLDPERGLDALATITHPSSLARFQDLAREQTDPDLRLRAIAVLGHSQWEARDALVAEIVRDPARPAAERMEALAMLGRIAQTPEALELMMDVALGPPQPAPWMSASQRATHPVADVRAAAILGVMQRGDQDAVRRLLEAGEHAGADPAFRELVDRHVGAYAGPDISLIIYDRARRRGVLTTGEVHQLIRDPRSVDRQRLRDVLPLIQDAKARETAERVASGV
jgi:hypothetical protein